MQDLTTNIKIVNGHVPQYKDQTEINKTKNGLYSTTINMLKRQSAHWRQTQPIFDKRLLMSSDGQTLNYLKIQGKEKKL